MAARVAAELSKENDLEVQTTKGGFGEFSVSIDGEKVIDTNRLWYPTLIPSAGLVCAYRGHYCEP